MRVSSEDVVDARSVGKDAYVGEARERGAVFGGGAPTGDDGEFPVRHAGGGFEEDADAFHCAWVDHDDAAAIEVRVIGPRAGAINGRMNYGGAAVEGTLDVSGHVMADGDDAGGLGDERGRGGVGIPALGTEREELRSVR